MTGGDLITSDVCTRDIFSDSDKSLTFNGEYVFMKDGTCDEEVWESWAEWKFEIARTAAFSVFIMFQLFNVLNCRSSSSSVFKLGVLSNKAINISIMLSVGLLLILVQGSQLLIPYIL